MVGAVSKIDYAGMHYRIKRFLTKTATTSETKLVFDEFNKIVFGMNTEAPPRLPEDEDDDTIIARLTWTASPSLQCPVAEGGVDAGYTHTSASTFCSSASVSPCAAYSANNAPPAGGSTGADANVHADMTDFYPGGMCTTSEVPDMTG